MIKAHPFKESYYKTACEWWEGHGWDAVPQVFLPVVGFVIEDDGIPRCMAWLKQENSTPIAMLEWLVTNPENTPRQTMRAIKAVTGTARDCAKAMGRVALFTYCKQPSLARVYENSGFQQTDSGMIHLTMPL